MQTTHINDIGKSLEQGLHAELLALCIMLTVLNTSVEILNQEVSSPTLPVIKLQVTEIKSVQQDA